MLEEYLQEIKDYVTLKMIIDNARDFGMALCNYNFLSAPIIVKVNGVAVKLKPEDVHFNIDGVKGEETNYNVVLDVKTK